MAETKKLEPLRRGDFGLAGHRYQQFDATVKSDLTLKDLENPELWVNVATKVNPGDEIRVRAEDDSFVALLHVTYSVGSQIRLKLVYGTELEAVDYDAMHESSSVYELKMRGPKKWCIIQKETGDIVKELIPTQLEAQKELADLERALAA